jgi:cytoskeletal protein CcmA (bactofilin family)
MWRKPADAKASSQSLESTAVVPAKIETEAPAVTPPNPPAEIASVAAPASSAALAPSAMPPSPAIASPPVARGISRISSGIRIKGEISGNDDFYIDGQAEGNFRFPQSKVTVGPNGKVQANIEAREIVIEGTVKGDLTASEGVQLGKSSHVQGSLTTPRVAINDGARLRGKVEMTRAGEGKQVEAATVVSSAKTLQTNDAPRAIAHASGE